MAPKYNGPTRFNMPRGELWDKIDRFCPKDMDRIVWHRTHACLVRACEFLGLQMVSTKEELDGQSPRRPYRCQPGRTQVDYGSRKIVVRGKHGLSKPTPINKVLSGDVWWDGDPSMRARVVFSNEFQSSFV